MTSAILAVQRAIYAKLRGDSGVDALLARDAVEGSPSGPAVYDGVPQAAQPEDATQFPYVVIGDDTVIDNDTDDTDGQEMTLTLHVWDQFRGRERVKAVQDAIYAALHRATLTLTGQRFVYCYFEFSESFKDPDGVSQHGVIRFRIAMQQT